MPHSRATKERGVKVFLSLVLVALLLLESPWFFLFIVLIAGPLILTSISGGWREWCIWMGMLVGFILFAEIRAKMGPTVEARPLFLYAIQLETLGGLLPVPAIWLQDHLQAGFLDAITTAIYLSYFLIPQVVAILLWRVGGPFARFVATTCLLFGVALLVHYFFPTAPPWMASAEGMIPPLDRILVRLMFSTSPELAAEGFQASGNDVAAMPSVHQGLTVLAMIALAHHYPRTRWIGWAYAVLMLFSITYLGEHYVVDGMAGAAMAWGGWRLSGRVRGTEAEVGIRPGI